MPREIARYVRRHGVTLRRDSQRATDEPAARRPRLRVAARTRAVDMPSRSPARVYHAVWAEALDVVERDELAACAEERCGTPVHLIDTAIAAPDAGALLRAEVQRGIDAGAFGSPFVIVDGEPFFGVDKFELIDEWLTRGGW